MCGLVKGGIIGCLVALAICFFLGFIGIKSFYVSFLLGASLTYIGTILGNEYL